MNVLFWVRKSYVSANGTSQIKCTISVAGTSLDFATRLSVAPDLWRQAKQRIVGTDAEYTNDALDKIRARLTEIKRDFEAKNKKYTLLQVKEAFFLNRLLVVQQEVPQETNICDDLAQIQKIRAELLALTNATREKSFFNIFIKFLKAKKLNGLMSCQIEKKHIFMFLDNLKSVKNTTRNKYTAFVKSVFSAMLERGIITSNPCTGIKKLPEMETKSTAFAPEHIKPLADLCKNESEEMYFFCMFIFYCFIRPAELRRLTVGQINLEYV